MSRTADGRLQWLTAVSAARGATRLRARVSNPGPRRVPGVAREKGVGASAIAHAGSQSEALMASTKSVGRVGNSRQSASPYGPNHVANRSGDNRLTGGHIFWRFRRADESCRLVARKRQHGDIPASHVRRQLLVRLRSEVMNVRQRGQVAGSILATGPSITNCQSGRASATPASKSRSIRSSMTPKNPRRGCGIAPGRVGQWYSRGRDRNAPRQRCWETDRCCDVSGLFASKRTGRPVKTRSARISSARSFSEERWRAGKRRQFVHAVVDHGERL